MKFFKGNYSQKSDGTISYNKGFLESVFGGGSSGDLNAMQYNQAVKQYNEQYALQKEAFDLNKQNMQFGQDLANRQQALSEESYYNGVSNQAKQLQALGINPASAGQSVSGATMSGGSAPSGVSSGSSSGNAKLDAFSGSGQALQFLSLMASLAQNSRENKLAEKSLELQADKQSKDYEVAKQNADTNSQNASTNRDLANNSIRLGDNTINFTSAQIQEIKANVDSINSKTTYQNWYNEVVSDGEKTLKNAGLNSHVISSMQNLDWQVAVGIGAVSLISAIKTSAESGDDIKVLADSLGDVMQSYDDLGKGSKEAVIYFYMRHPALSQSTELDPPIDILDKAVKYNWNYEQTYNALKSHYKTVL